MVHLSEKSQQIQVMFDKISNHYDFLNRFLSCGQDLRWRKRLIQSLPKVWANNGVLVDVACGTGDVLFSVNKKRSDYKKFIGIDISSGMLAKAEERKKNILNLKNDILFTQASAEELPIESNTVDAVTIAFGFRNIDDRKKALKEFFRILKPNGVLFVLEFFPTKNSIINKPFMFYFKHILPKIGGIFSDRSAYEYLPESIASMPDRDLFTEHLKLTGFAHVTQHSWMSGSVCLFSAYS